MLSLLPVHCRRALTLAVTTLQDSPRVWVLASGQALSTATCRLGWSLNRSLTPAFL